jgi:hypothetical protein
MATEEDHRPLLEFNGDTKEKATISVVDGTKKLKYGNEYWVQRNVVTIRVTANILFDEVSIYCHKRGSETRFMQTLPYYRALPYFDASVKVKLPMTSGRPETQKEMWLSCTFTRAGQIVHQCTSKTFLVCSRPGSSPLPSTERQYPFSRVEIGKNRKLSFVPIQSNTYQTVSVTHTTEVVSPLPRRNSPSAPELPFTGIIQLNPVVTAIQPNYGTHHGGTQVTIHTRNIQLLDAREITVYFGLLPGIQVCVLSENTISVITPPRFMPGTVEVSVLIDKNEITEKCSFIFTEHDSNTQPVPSDSVYNVYSMQPLKRSKTT